RGNGVDMRRANENAERVVGFRHPPRAVSRLRQMHLAIPTGHDDVIGVATRAREAQTLPKRDRCLQVVAGNDSESTDSFSDRHRVCSRDRMLATVPCRSATDMSGKPGYRKAFLRGG